jgi:hypothetical protein
MQPQETIIVRPEMGRFTPFAPPCPRCRIRGLPAAPGAAALPELASQAGIIRCVVGNPFRPPAAARRDPPIPALAQAAYDERILPSGHLDNARLAVLSDALEEAGCADHALLTHLRSPGPHVRGCWAIDLVLGKS